MSEAFEPGVAPAPPLADGGTNTSAFMMKNVVDRNTLAWWALLAISAALAAAWSPWGALFFAVALVVDDALVYLAGRTFLFDSELRIRRNYQWMHNLYDGTTGRGRDLGFNVVQEDGTLSQSAKYDHMVRQLGLVRGMKVCDVGCGYGDWLRHCRDVVGCEVVGVNLTPEQAAWARAMYGIDVVVTNWKDIAGDPALRERFYGQFDAVTFMDTVEHYVTMEDRNDQAKQDAVYRSMCELAANLMRPGSASGRVFLSCLHQVRRPRTLRFYVASYLMDKLYSGFYPFDDDGPMKHCASWFDVESVEDKTEDYRLTGVRDRKHFQAVRIAWTPRKVGYVLAVSLLDPFVAHRLVYYLHDSWMWFYGDEPYDDRYDLEKRLQSTFVRLLWITLRKRPAAGASPS